VHEITEFARVQDGRVWYPKESQQQAPLFVERG